MENKYFSTEEIIEGGLEFNIDDIIHLLVQDARNQFSGFFMMKGARVNIDEIIKVWIPKAELKTLEEYISSNDDYKNHISEITQKFLEINPKIFEEYDSLIARLKDPELDYDKLDDILKKEEILLNLMENSKL